jgi:3-oxoacyl-[acyl-carrier protein] reductase
MLQGRTAVITGGSRGIGRAIAEEYARQGCNLAVLYHGNEQAAVQVVAAAQDCGVRALGYQCDVSDWKSVEATCGTILSDFDTVDILVNNAGIVHDNLLMRMREQDIDEVLAVNLKGAMAMTRHLTPALLKSPRGRVINISSVVGLMGNPGQSNYAAAKSGLIGFTKSIAREFASRSVTCNVIAPGFIDTDMTSALPDSAAEKLTSLVPLKRVGTPEDIAGVAAFLACDQASYITGQVIQVDGGMRM